MRCKIFTVKIHLNNSSHDSADYDSNDGNLWDKNDQILSPDGIFETTTGLQQEQRVFNIYVCLNSQHSKWRLNKFYPQFGNLIPWLDYGLHANSILKNLKNRIYDLRYFDNIDLEKLSAQTAPEIVLLQVSSRSFLLPLGYSTATFHIFTAIAVETDFEPISKPYHFVKRI